jgi:transglutaminase-like putative cysteine protease
MNRREFLRTSGVISAGLVLPRVSKLLANSLPSPHWRRFVVTTRVEIPNIAAAARVWVPAALIRETPFQRTISNRCHCEGGTATLVESRLDGLAVFAAQFPDGAQPRLTVTSEIATKEYAVALSGPRRPQPLSRAEAEHYLRPTKLVPTDGIVRETAMEITREQKSELGKAYCIYKWIVENSFRDPKVRGCGTGNIRVMLESRNLGGKCADLNALFVGLARAAGLPARDVYGVRVAKSRLGYQSLGPTSVDVTKAQHCRAEVYVSEYGWIPVDPADVRKVVLEEPPGNRSLNDELVQHARRRMFGSWEMNWIAFNFAQDVTLPGSAGPALGFLMYPQAEIAGRRLDSLDPENFKYKITARELDSI